MSHLIRSTIAEMRLEPSVLHRLRDDYEARKRMFDEECNVIFQAYEELERLVQPPAEPLMSNDRPATQHTADLQNIFAGLQLETHSRDV